MIYMSDSAEIAFMPRKQCIFFIKIILTWFKGPFLELLGLKYGQMSWLAQKISPKSKIFQFSSVYHALCISFVVQTYLFICLYILKHISVITTVIFEYFWILLAFSFGSGTCTWSIFTKSWNLLSNISWELFFIWPWFFQEWYT